MNRKVKKKAFIMKVRFITFRTTASKWLTKRQGFTDKQLFKLYGKKVKKSQITTND